MDERERTMKGTIHSFNSDEGFGYIEGSDGRLYFLHYGDVDVDDGPVQIGVGDAVEFNTRSDGDGTSATDVRKSSS